MANLDLSGGILGSSVAVKVRAVPPGGWVGLAVAIAVGVVLFHQFSRDDDDVSWTDPEQPPENVPAGPALPMTMPVQGSRPLRGRSRPRFAAWSGDDSATGAYSGMPSAGRAGAHTWSPS